MGKKSRRKAPRERKQQSAPVEDAYILARRWDGGGCVPLCLIPLLRAGTWNDPAVLPSAQARQKLGEVGASGNPLLRALFAGDVDALEKLTD